MVRSKLGNMSRIYKTYCQSLDWFTVRLSIRQEMDSRETQRLNTMPRQNIPTAGPAGPRPSRLARALGVIIPAVFGVFIAAAFFACGKSTSPDTVDAALAAKGKDIFRFNTFGDETFWTDTLRIHEVITQAVDPTTALSV